ncbi:MAG TPA: LAGLIDADG family homing endonuclease [Nitrospiraceae bacterium]
MKRLKIAWAAGFFDGEGCVSISSAVERGKYRRYQLSVIIAQKVREPLDVFVSLFGGSVTALKVHGSTYFQYKTTGFNAWSILQSLLPYLTVKREVAEVGMQFQEVLESTLPKKGTKRTESQNTQMELLYQQAKYLNQRNSQKDYTAEDAAASSPDLTVH